MEEALAVASLDSHQALARVSSTDSTQAAEQLLSTLIKYYIRLTTRPTPYGLFSGVSIGTFGEKSDMVVSNTGKHTKRARVDTEWLYAVIKQIESTREIRRLLKVRFNEYLLSELRPPIVNTDALDHVIHALSRITQNSQVKEYCEQLESIRTSIAKYNASPIGNDYESA